MKRDQQEEIKKDRVKQMKSLLIMKRDQLEEIKKERVKLKKNQMN